MIILLAQGLIEQILNIDIVWFYIPVGIIGIWLIVEIIRSIIRHKKNKDKKDPLDSIEEAIQMDGKDIDSALEGEERIYTVDNGKLQSAENTANDEEIISKETENNQE